MILPICASLQPFDVSFGKIDSTSWLRNGLALSGEKGFIAAVDITLSRPDVDELDDVTRALRDWQRDDAPLQLHPGDLGWFWRFGANALAAAVRTWSQDGQFLAIGFLDGPDLLRMTVAPQAWDEDEVARHVVTDVTDPNRILPPGKVAVELPSGTRVGQLLADAGWSIGESWTPLSRDLALPVEPPSLRIEIIEPGRESLFTAVHRSAWESPRFTDELWRTMATGTPFTDARCLLGYDEDGIAVAGVTIWSAGPGKPGLLEPMGVHADHRRRGHGISICLAAAAELQKLGSSSAGVCTPSARTAAVATYEAAGFQRFPERLDQSRDA